MPCSNRGVGSPWHHPAPLLCMGDVPEDTDRRLWPSPPGAGVQDWDLAQHRRLTWATLVPPPHPLRALHLLNAGWDQREALGPQHGEQTQPSCQEEQLPCQGPCVRSGGTWPPGHPFTPGLVGPAPSPSQRPLGSVGWVGRHRFLWIS